MFGSRDDILHWTQFVAYVIGFVGVIMIRGRTSFVLIGCERSGQYRSRKKDLVRTMTGSRKCRYPFKLHAKQVVGGER